MIISAQTFFLSKNIVCRSFLSAFMARALNSIIKSAMFFFLCLNILIFHSTSATFVLLLNIFLSSYTKSSQSWVPVSLSSSSSFFWIYMPATSSLRWARIAVILLLVFIILLLLKNNYISFHQFLNFILSPSNHSGSRTMLLGILSYMFSFNHASISDILFV